MHARAELLRSEYVVAVEGPIVQRSAETVNPELATGEIDLIAEKLWIFNESRTPPFPIEGDLSVGEEARLKYRYVDLRRPHMQRNVELRHRVNFAVRETLNGQGFLEIETPFMTRSTPEGARDFLVPSRLQLGSFYALPQSPQLFKQLLMISGYEKYFQIVRCFRDEDLRADRQPEFTQIDLEMAFVQQEEILDVIESLMVAVSEVAGYPAPERPFSAPDPCPGHRTVRHGQAGLAAAAHGACQRPFPAGAAGDRHAADGDPGALGRSDHAARARRMQSFRNGSGVAGV